MKQTILLCRGTVAGAEQRLLSPGALRSWRPLRRGIGPVLLLLAFALNPGCDCEEQPPTTDLDPCGNRCIPGIEVCNPNTGMCEPASDMGGDAADADLDAPEVVPDQDMPREEGADVLCRDDDDCAADEYCDENGACQTGCRVDDPDTPADEDNCEGGLQCHPIRHVCVTGCVSDSECDLDEYCDLDTGVCEYGCRIEPDNCPPRVGGEDVECDEDTHRCVDGPCDDDEDCPDAFYCDPTNDLCTLGCRFDENGDNCGSCEDCDPEYRYCVPRTCDCEAGDSLQDCDEQCNEPDGSISACYCDQVDGLCIPGCRIFDNDPENITDNCQAGTICDEDLRECIAGCRTDDDCPYGTWCDLDDLECVEGCQAGQCGVNEVCCLEETGCGTCAYRECCELGCDDDEDCPKGTYCDAGGNCATGCRIDDPATTEIDEDSCEGDLVCDPVTRFCTLPGCTESCGECPLGQYCNDSNQCMPGCNGDDACCPAGQPCRGSDPGFCGCLSDLDCPDNTHCEMPYCVPDCTEGGCPPPLMCDTASGRCVGGCVDPLERLAYERDDTPETGRCVLFSPTDPDDHCRPDATHLPPDSYCDDEPLTYCQDAYVCTGGDQDWYVLDLNAGDFLTFGAELDLPDGAFFYLVLMREPLVLPDGRLNVVAAAVDPDPEDSVDEVWSVEIQIDQDNLYYLRATANAQERVPYHLDIRTDRAYRCYDDDFEPNGLPNEFAPEIPNSDLLWSEELSICLGDRDFFGIELFYGNRLTAIVDPGNEREALALTLGTHVGTADDIVPTTYGLPYSDPGDPGDENIVAVNDYTVGATGYYFVKIVEPSGLAETDYSLDVLTEVGSAVCADDPFEDNDEPHPIDEFPNAATYRINSLDALNSLKEFPRGRRCPTDDADYFRFNVTHADFAGYYLTANLYQDQSLVEVALYNSQLGLIDITGEGDPTRQIVHQVTAADLYNATPELANNIWVLVRPRSGVTVPTLGAVYDLELKYEEAPCDDDDLEPNNDEDHPAEIHSTVLIAQDQECGALHPPVTEICAGGGHDCYCQHLDDLVLCPSNDDWYHLRVIAGDILSIRLHPTSTVDLFDVGLTLYGSGEVVNGLYTSDSVVIENVGADSVSGRPIVDFLIEVTAFGQPPFTYDLDLEVLADYSRNCPRDEWDAELEEYPNQNEVYCHSSSCILQPGGAGIEGNLCYWDPQDWFKFTLSQTSDVRVYAQYYIDLGEMTGMAYRDVPTYPGPGAPVYPECPETTGDPAGCGCFCPCEYIVRQPDGENYRAGCRVPINEEFTTQGQDWVFYDVPPGSYHVRLAMRGFASDVPTNYTAYLKINPCGDGALSPGEECDAISVPGDTCPSPTHCVLPDEEPPTCVCE